MFGYGIAGVALMVFALVHFVKYRSGNFIWLYVIIFLGPLGAIVYLVVEVLPELRGSHSSFKWLGRRSSIKRLEGLVLDNPSAGNYEDLAELYLEQKNYARARECFGKAISSRTDIPDPFYGRALCALEMGETAAAIPDLEKAVSIEPKHDYNRAAGLLANAYAATGRDDDADRLFRQTLKTSTLSETQFYYARFLANHGRLEEARQLAQQIVRKRATVSPQLRRADRHWFGAAEALLKQMASAPVAAGSKR
jgi:hypothetical protein